MLEQIVGEFRKFVFELELDARRKKGRTFEQTANQWVDAILQDTAEPFRYSRVSIRKFASLLIEQLKFPIVKIEKFVIHVCFTDD